MKAFLDAAVRFRFIMKTLLIRGRFFAGKASLVEAAASSSRSEPALFTDSRGRPLRQGLLTRVLLGTRPPLTGSQGWDRYAAAVRADERLLFLECSWCGHHYILRFPEGVGSHADAYECGWFSFLRDDLEGSSWLACGHCEQKARPRVQSSGIP
ncbi:MAG: hypothetical protein HZB91_14845 [Elusimicrobia bacterium]|nr:hypothetical protein [Elusimicrobiota bacterium]